MKDKIAVLGGDLRQYAAALELDRKNWEVSLWGLETADERKGQIKCCETYKNAVDGAMAVVLPLPASVDGILLNCPFSSKRENIKLSELIDAVDVDCTIIGGRLPKETVDRANRRGLVVKDYFESEEFQIQNAYITAEAALSIAMNSLDKNIRGSRIAITGYGRIAKHLIKLLLSMGADITVAARKGSDLEWAASDGCSVLQIGDTDPMRKNIYELAYGYDVIYNTVPYRLFDKEFLVSVDRNTFIIDLASVPGGVDIIAAKEIGANVLWATSLPGKYAPVSAGELIAHCVDNILKSEVIGT